MTNICKCAWKTGVCRSENAPRKIELTWESTRIAATIQGERSEQRILGSSLRMPLPQAQRKHEMCGHWIGALLGGRRSPGPKPTRACLKSPTFDISGRIRNAGSNDSSLLFDLVTRPFHGIRLPLRTHSRLPNPVLVIGEPWDHHKT